MRNEESQPILTAENNILVFWEDIKEDGLASAKAGRIMFDSILMMRVSVPGDNKSNMEYWVKTTYPDEYPHPIYGKERFNPDLRQRYGRYIDDHLSRQGGPQKVDGTPVDQWALINRAQSYMLKHNGVYSVEALAGLTDAQTSALGLEGRKLVQQAKDWIATAQNSAAAMQAMSREREMQAKFDLLQAKIDELTAAFEELPPDAQAAAKQTIAKRRGRPPKMPQAA